jgi:hypothetical protein
MPGVRLSLQAQRSNLPQQEAVTAGDCRVALRAPRNDANAGAKIAKIVLHNVPTPQIEDATLRDPSCL